MKNFQKLYFLALFFVVAACNVTESDPGHDITATINGETWFFYNVTTDNTDEGDAMLRAQGYLNGDQGAEPANLEIVFVGLSNIRDAGEGYTADFAPTNAGTSAYAVVDFPDQNRHFNTTLDPETTGTFTITEVANNTMSGNFRFKAKDRLGNVLDIESAEFDDIEIDQ
ncbi:hypothetical protein D770_03150 [Flammeovirgaceae bacterium 311]|nr:hypothetical protein D770_03150 [Flammeovirgaceae bacterium 311]